LSPRRIVLLAAFFLSGCAALVFELVWTRLLLLSLGATATAVGAVLAAFMGGMAIGSALAGTRPVARLDPILTFAALEGFVGAYALASPPILDVISGMARPGTQFLGALLALMPATVAMGASLPVLTRAFCRSGERAAVGVGTLYAANTAGAVLGPLLAVFWFFPAAGLEDTLRIGAGLDFFVCGLLLAIRKRIADSSPQPVATPGEDASVSWLLLASVAFSGASAMVYEVAWGRTLSMVYGSSVYGVSITLSTFLLGIALGSAFAARLVRRRPTEEPLLRLARALAASAIFAFLSLLVARSLPFLFLNFYTSSSGRETALFLSQFVIASILMLPSSIASGAILPFAVDALPRAGDVSFRLARLYGANLAGSSLGALLASALLLASLGIEFSIRAAAVFVLALALLVLVRSSKFSVATGAIVSSFILLILALDPSGEGSLKSFGIYSGARTYARYEIGQLRDIVQSHKLLFYRDGPTASVAVQEIERFRLLKINGKTDASNGPGDKKTQLLLAHLPFLAADARRVAVVGWGSGMTVGAVLEHPVEKVDAFEIEPAVIEASRFFEPDNGTPLEDERLTLVMGDARSALRRGTELYDVVISEPSNPWLTGVANLFTRDFFEIVAERLTEDGVLCQWFHLYGMSESSARSLLATLRQVFPHVVAFQDRDLVLLASRKPLRLSIDRLGRIYREDAIAATLAQAGLKYPADVLVGMSLDERGAEAFSKDAALNTDDNMRLELQAPRSLYRDDVEAILKAMREHPPDVFAQVQDFRSEAEVRLELAASQFTAGNLEAALDQARRSVEAAPSFENQKLLGQVLQRLGRDEEARAALERALAEGGDATGRKFVEAMLRSLREPAGP
jgi:spermidine synthase